MLEKRCNRIFEIVVLAIIGLIPLLWFKGDFLITGADINFSLDPTQEFWRRTQAWVNVYNGGQDNSINFPTLFFCAIQMLFYNITHSLMWTEKLAFIFWFMFSLFSIYYFVTNIILPRRNFLVRIVPCLFYQFNFYQLSCWSGVHIAGLTALATLPLLFGLFTKIVEGYNNHKRVILFIVLSFTAGGVLVNIPTALVFCSVFIFYIIFRIGVLLKLRNWLKLKRLILIVGILFFGCVFINSYILLPLFNSIIAQTGYSKSLMGDYNVQKYLWYQSRFSNILNVLRLMGNSELYDTWRRAEYYYPFFVKYINKRSLILLSFILPTLAFLGVLLKRSNKFVRFCFPLALVGIVFSMGVHFPMGRIYKWLILNVPGFFIFRSPWLKFGLLVAFAYSVLAGIFCDWLYRYLKYICRKKRWFMLLVPNTFLIAVVILYLGFMHSFILGEMFPGSEDRKTINPLHVKIPNYVFEYYKWINRKTEDFSLALLPSEKTNIYEWGYGGIEDISLRLVNKSVLYEKYEELGVSESLEKMYRIFIDNLYNRLSYKLYSFLDLIGSKYIVQRNDFTYYFYGDRDSPEFISNRLKEQENIFLEKIFGEWDVYNCKLATNRDFVYASNSLAIVRGGEEGLVPLSEITYLESLNHLVFLVCKLENFKQGLLNSLKGLNLVNNFFIFIDPSIRSLFINRDYIKRVAWPVGFLITQNNREITEFRNRYMYIFKEAVYTVCVKLIPRFRDILLKGTKGVAFTPIDILNWKHKPNEVVFKEKIDDNGLDMDVYFDGPSNEDEYVQLRAEVINIDLEKYPLMELEYEIEDPNIQTIEIILGIDCDNDGEVDDYLKGLYTKEYTARMNRFRVNILNRIIQYFHKKSSYKIVLIELYLHKIWGENCSSPMRSRNYRFRIKNLSFSDFTQKGLVEFRRYRIDYSKKDIRYKAKRVGNLFHVKVPIDELVNLKLFHYIEVKYKLSSPAVIRSCSLFLRLSERDRDKLVFGDFLPIEQTVKKDIKVSSRGYNGNLREMEFRIELEDKDYKGDIIDIEGIKIYRRIFSDKWKAKGLGISIIIGDKRFHAPQKIWNVQGRDIFIKRELKLKEGLNRIKIDSGSEDIFYIPWISISPNVGFQMGIVPKISYEKSGECLYRIKAEDVSDPFILVMNNNYNDKWDAYILKGGGILCKIKDHFIANGFANAWIINNNQQRSLEIMVKYNPQDLFKIGAIISAITGVVLIALVIWKH